MPASREGGGTREGARGRAGGGKWRRRGQEGIGEGGVKGWEGGWGEEGRGADRVGGSLEGVR
eukprot:717706-Rhodomonas_salina.1